MDPSRTPNNSLSNALGNISARFPRTSFSLRPIGFSSFSPSPNTASSMSLNSDTEDDDPERVTNLSGFARAMSFMNTAVSDEGTIQVRSLPIPGLSSGSTSTVQEPPNSADNDQFTPTGSTDEVQGPQAQETLTTILTGSGSRSDQGQVEHETHPLQSATDIDLASLIPPNPPITNFRLPPGYPAPSSVISDAARIGQLISSGLLEKLSCVPYERVQLSGPFTIQSSFTRVILSPYDQVVFAITGRYYAALPESGFDLRTFQLLHQFQVAYTGAGYRVAPEYEVNNEAFSNMISTNIGHIMLKLARLLLKTECMMQENISSVMTALECTNSLQEITRIYPAAEIAYRVAYEFCHHGQTAIEPIHELILEDDLLSGYIDSLGSGNTLITPNDINLSPRPAQLNAPRPGAPGTTAVPPMLPTPQPTGPQARNNAEAPLLPFPVVNQPVENTGNSTTGDLQSQGDPTRVQIIRDTARFRAGIQEDANLRHMMQQLLEQSANQTARITTLNQSVSDVVSKLAEVTEALGSLINQVSRTDLVDRVTFNRTVFGGQNQQVTNGIAAAAPVSLAAPNVIRGFIERVRAMTCLANDPTLPEEIRTELRARGDNNTAAAIVDAAFNNAQARVRIITKLTSMMSL